MFYTPSSMEYVISPLRKNMSIKDNDWNALALSTKEHAGHLTEITLRASESVRISKENNQWNKLAIELQAGKRDVDCQ